jgi:hypothetical protein
MSGKDFIEADFIGKQSNQLTIVQFTEKNKHRQKMCLVSCSCGASKIIRFSLFKSGTQKHCGAAIHRMELNKKKGSVFKSGDKYNCLTFLRFEKQNKHNSPMWLCLCDCGKEKIILASSVKNGHTKSCGCLPNAITINTEKSKNLTELDTIRYAARSVYRQSYKDGNLSFEDFLILSQKNCFYCGASRLNKTHLVYKTNGEKKVLSSKREYSGHQKNPDAYFVYNGLDRIDSKLPHDKENLVPCCYICNKMKLASSLEEFVCQIKKIHDHMSL